jgi:fatty-acyl-CoA synthase
LRSLRVVFSAGATLQEVVDRAKADFGFRVSNVYGSSEVLALAAFWDFERASTLCGTAGGRLVSDAMRVRCVDAEGHRVGRGQPGELQFAGPLLTCGYLANDAATRSAFSEDGWFKSKDLGSVSDADGREFHYVSRLDDAIRLKGFLVSPGEIESMLQTHPAVAAAQVVGVPQRGGEELAAAFVTLHAGASVDPEHLRDHCRARMASYKVPALLEIVERFPTTLSANGDKVMKNRLRDMARAMVTHE